MNIDIIGVPLWQGCGHKGPEAAPSALITPQLTNLFESKGHTITSISMLPEIKSPSKIDSTQLKYSEAVIKICDNLKQVVNESFIKKHFPLIIGGDHALAIGTIAGLNQSIPANQLSVIWIDAHTDINTDITSNSHNIHGMPVASSLGFIDNPGLGIYGNKTSRILTENLFYIGVRSIDNPEETILQEYNIKNIRMPYIQKKGILQATKDILNSIKTPYIHLSFDVDFLSSDYFKATGLPIPNGPTLEEAIICLKEIIKSGKVISMDFVEYSPDRDNNFKGKETCYLLLHKIAEALKVI